MTDSTKDISEEAADLKGKTARSLKWNLIDRVATQVLYAVTGIILARLLSSGDFGLVGAMLVFQAFANMFIDSGFSSALIQRKKPEDADYATVMWFNIGIAVGIYIILYVSAPLIARLFDNDTRLIGMSRVMFVSFILNAACIVQHNRLTKQMHVRPIAIADIISLMAGGIAGIWLAVAGYGAWAIVWQTVALNGVRAIALWVATRWVPALTFSWRRLRSFMAVGSGVLATSFLNVLFTNIYSFFIGNKAGLSSLGYYTQGDKWSKMGVMSLSQTMTSSFLPTLAGVQDDRGRYIRVSTKMNRLAAYLTFPAMGLLAVMAAPIFHTLFGVKWDAAIPLFVLLSLRGIFTILTLQYNNFILSLGKSRMIVRLELFRDLIALGALIATLPYIALTRSGDICYGLRIMIYGQLAASAFTWLATLVITARLTGRTAAAMLGDYVPYLGGAALSCAAAYALTYVIGSAPLLLCAQCVAGAGVYLAVNAIGGSVIQRETLEMTFRRKNKRQ